MSDLLCVITKRKGYLWQSKIKGELFSVYTARNNFCRPWCACLSGLLGATGAHQITSQLFLKLTNLFSQFLKYLAMVSHDWLKKNGAFHFHNVTAERRSHVLWDPPIPL